MLLNKSGLVASNGRTRGKLPLRRFFFRSMLYLCRIETFTPSSAQGDLGTGLRNIQRAMRNGLRPSNIWVSSSEFTQQSRIGRWNLRGLKNSTATVSPISGPTLAFEKRN